MRLYIRETALFEKLLGAIPLLWPIEGVWGSRMTTCLEMGPRLKFTSNRTRQQQLGIQQPSYRKVFVFLII